MSMLDDIDPADIKEIIETEDMRTAIIKKDAIHKYIPEAEEELENGHKITVEGEELVLLGFREIYPKEGPEDAIVYLKIVPEKGQVQFAVADHPDMENTHNKVEPVLLNVARMSGFTLVNIRTMITELIGTIKRKKGIDSLDDLADIPDAPPKDPKEMHPWAEYPRCCYECLTASGNESCDYLDAEEPVKCQRYIEYMAV